MRAVRIHRFGGPDVMTIEEVKAPEPKDDELLVHVRAASVNPVDYKTREGQFPPVSQDKLPITLGRDISGTVERVGAAVRSFTKGDSVFAMLGPERGGFAELVIVKSSEAASKPARLSHSKAAAVPLAALTAWQGLVDHGGLAPGQRVLVHGGAGGVGHFAVQIAKAKGAAVFATVARDDFDFMRELGCDQAIDYKNQRFEDIVRDVNIVFDLIAGQTQERSWRVLRRGGILVSTLGQPSQQKAAEHGVRAAGYMAQPNGSQLAEIGRLIDEGKIRPFVEATFPFEAAPEAEQRLKEQHVRGKIVLELAA